MNSVPSKSKSSSRKFAHSQASTSRVPSGSRPTYQAPGVPDNEKVQWTFLTNHSHVLVLLARNPSLVLRQVAQQVGITERAVQRIIAELEAGGFVVREKIGRQNHYQIRTDQPLRHPIESHRAIGDLLELLNSPPATRAASRRRATGSSL